MATRRASIRSLSSASSSSSELIRCANDDSDALVAAVTGSGERAGTKSFPFGDQGRHREALHATTELFRSAVAEVAHLDQGLASGLAGRALGDDEDPDGLDGTVARLGLALGPTAQGGPGGLDGVEGIGLAGPTTLLAIRSVDLEDLDADSAQVAGQARAIGPGALHADLGDVAEGSEPAEQRLVARCVGLEALRAEQPAERVEGGSDMDVEVSVDATSHTTRSFYDGHGHPSCLMELRDGTAVPDRSDGRSRLLVATRTNHPNSETGRAAVNVPLVGLGRRRLATSRDSKSGRTYQHSRSYSGPAIKRWIPQRSINVLGQGSACSNALKTDP